MTFVLSSPAPSLSHLPAVVWDGLALTDERGDDTTVCVQDLEGWYGTADIDAQDVERTLVDGAAHGPKTLKAREMTLSGWGVGARPVLVDFHDQLTVRTAARTPGLLSVSDPTLGDILRMQVRAVGRMEPTWQGTQAFRYQIPLRAVDPRKYASDERAAILRAGHLGGAGRVYPRRYREGATGLTVTARRLTDGHQVRASAFPDGWWIYQPGDIPNQVTMINRGSADSPVLATYTGPLAMSRLSNGQQQIVVDTLPAGMVLYINTETLAATAPGGYSRAKYLLAGSQPLVVPARSSGSWSLYVASGTGSVALQWRDAWW